MAKKKKVTASKVRKTTVSASKKKKSGTKTSKKSKTVSNRAKSAKLRKVSAKRKYKKEYDDIADDPSGYKLPPQIKVDGVIYNTPSRLHGLSHSGSGRLNNRFKILVYAIYKRHRAEYGYSLQYICDQLFFVRDQLALDNRFPDRDTFDWILYKAMTITREYKVRNEINDSVVSTHENYPWIKKYRFHCFECRRILFSGYANTMENIDQELIDFWEARDRYLAEIDDTSLDFSVMFFHEHYTNFVLVDFNNIRMEGGDVSEFRRILNEIQIENDYGNS